MSMDLPDAAGLGALVAAAQSVAARAERPGTTTTTWLTRMAAGRWWSGVPADDLRGRRGTQRVVASPQELEQLVRQPSILAAVRSGTGCMWHL